MGELCPGAVLETAAVPPPLDLFPWSPPIEPGAHRPAPPELPDHEDLSRTGSEWAVPRRRAGAGGRAPAEISWSSNPPPSPSPSPCPQPPPSRTSVRASGSSAARRSLPRPRAAGGGCAPPRVTCSRSILRVPGCRRPAGDSGPTVETPRPARRRSVERLAAAGRRRACIEADKGAGCARCGAVLEPVAVPPPRFRGPSNPPPRPSPSPCPQPPLPRTAGGSCTPPAGSPNPSPSRSPPVCLDHHRSISFALRIADDDEVLGS